MNYLVTRICRAFGDLHYSRRQSGSLLTLDRCLCCLCSLVIAGCGGVASTMPNVPMIQTTTTLSAAPTVVTVGAAVTLSASVTYPPAETASGLVNFSDGSVFIDSVFLDSKGAASLKVTTFAVGVHIITARFAGNEMITASMSQPVSVTVLAPSMSSASALRGEDRACDAARSNSYRATSKW